MVPSRNLGHQVYLTIRGLDEKTMGSRKNERIKKRRASAGSPASGRARVRNSGNSDTHVRLGQTRTSSALWPERPEEPGERPGQPERPGQRQRYRSTSE